MSFEVYDGNSGIPMGKAEIGGGGGGGADGVIYQFIGSVDTLAELEALDTSAMKPGYVYDVKENGKNYALTENGDWDDLGGKFDGLATKDELNAKQDLLHPKQPLEISVDVIEPKTSSNIAYSVANNGQITNTFPTGGSSLNSGWIDFYVPDNVNINALTDYWRFGSTDGIKSIIKSVSGQNYEIFKVYSEEGEVARLWHGSGNYRIGASSSTGSGFSSQTATGVVEHVAGSATTHVVGANSKDTSKNYTITSSRLSRIRFTQYQETTRYNDWGTGTCLYSEKTGSRTRHLPNIRLYTSAEDTEGIMLVGTTSTEYLKVNTGDGLTVQNNKLIADTTKVADVDFSNATDAAKIMMANASLPSTTKHVDLTLLASGSSYTAPADGWVLFNKNSGVNNEYLVLENSLLVAICWIPTAANGGALFLPVQQGEEFKVSYSASGATNKFRFVYAKGSESEAS